MTLILATDRRLVALDTTLPEAIERIGVRCRAVFRHRPQLEFKGLRINPPERLRLEQDVL
jgi:hypothetical protein